MTEAVPKGASRRLTFGGEQTWKGQKDCRFTDVEVSSAQAPTISHNSCTIGSGGNTIDKMEGNNWGRNLRTTSDLRNEADSHIAKKTSSTRIDIAVAIKPGTIIFTVRLAIQHPIVNFSLRNMTAH